MAENKSNNEWRGIVDALTIDTLLPKKQTVISCKSTDSLPDVLELLTKNRILSAPVYDVEKKEYNAFVDLVDILTIMVVVTKCRGLAEAVSGAAVEWKTFLAKELSVIQELKVSELVGSASALDGTEKSRSNARNPWCAVWRGYPLNSLLDMFSKDVNIHRIAVTDDEGEVIGVISQSAVIEFVDSKLGSLPALASSPLSAFVCSDRAIRSVKQSDNLTDAYIELLSSGLSGLAVVDENGRLVGALTASNLRRHGYDLDGLLTIMTRTVKDLLEEGQEGGSAPVTVPSTSTLQDVTTTLLGRHIHRIFTVDEEGRPNGVVSLCDIVTYLSNSAAQ